jgi:hypothetical protein
VIPWVRIGSGFYRILLHCLGAEMSLRWRQRFPGKEMCLPDHLSPFGTSAVRPLVLHSPLSMVALTAVRYRDDKVYSVTASCWQGAMKGPAASGLTMRGVIKVTAVVGHFHVHQWHL